MLDKAKEVSIKALGRNTGEDTEHKTGLKRFARRPSVSDETEKSYEDRLGLLY